MNKRHFSSTIFVLVWLVAMRAGAGPYQDAVLADAPAAYWSFDDSTTATTTPDLSGNNHPLTFMSPGTGIPPPNDTQTSSPGRPGLLSNPGNRAAFFNGNTISGSGTPNSGAVWSTAMTGNPPLPDPDAPGDNTRTFPQQYNLFDRGDVFTIEAWVKDTSTNANNSTSRRFCGNGNMAFGVEGGIPHFTTFGKFDYKPSRGNVPLGEWHHLVVVWENNNGSGNSQATFYIDGVNVGTSVATVNGISNSNTGMIGAGRRRLDVHGQQWIGLIDELAIYHSKLSDVQVAAHYAASPLPGPPVVTLHLSGSPIAEAGGQAIVTAEPSWAYTNDVTVLLDFSGTAVFGSNYIASATQIVIPAGSSNGTMTLTAVLNTVAETPDRTIVIDINSVLNGSTGSPARVSATITDAGDIALPNVSLFLTGSPMAEAWGEALVAAALSEAFPYAPVTVNLAFSGSAGLGTDYARSATQIVLAPGQTNGTILLTAIPDLLPEAPDRTIVVDIDSVVNASIASPNQVIATIADAGLTAAHPRSIGVTFGDGTQGPESHILAGSVRPQRFWNHATWVDHWNGYYGPLEDGFGWTTIATKADDGSAVNLRYQNYWATYTGACTVKGPGQAAGPDPHLQTQGITMTCDEPARTENENVFEGIPFGVYDVIVSKNGVITNYMNQTGTTWKNLGLWHQYSIQFIQFAASPPTINNDPGPRMIGSGSRTWLQGTLTYTTAPPTSVSIYWGTSDGGTEATHWEHTINLGVITNAVPFTLSHILGGLPLNSLIYYRFYAENPEGGGRWAPSSTNFHTTADPFLIIR